MPGISWRWWWRKLVRIANNLQTHRCKITGCSMNFVPAIIAFRSWFDHTTAWFFFHSTGCSTPILFAWDVYSSVCIQQGHLWGRLFANCPHTDCPGWSGLVGHELPGPKGAHLRFLAEISMLTLFSQYWYFQLVVLPGSYLHGGLRHMAADRCSQFSSQYLMERNSLFAKTCQEVIRCYHVAKCMCKGPIFSTICSYDSCCVNCFPYYKLLKLLEPLCRTETGENSGSGWGDHRESAGGATSRSTYPWKHGESKWIKVCSHDAHKHAQTHRNTSETHRRQLHMFH